MKTKTILLTINFLFLLSCSNQEEIPIERIANEALEGAWLMLSWHQDGVEVTGDVVDYYLDFIIGMETKGISKWETYTDRLLTRQYVAYEIINAGNKIDFDGQVLDIIFFQDSTLVLEGEYNNELWEIKAIKN